ncbi:hypothetical protein [Mastigocladopsis repens]|nr:hypothetical protein [Mastigocladopsis repens]
MGCGKGALEAMLPKEAAQRAIACCLLELLQKYIFLYETTDKH